MLKSNNLQVGDLVWMADSEESAKCRVSTLDRWGTILGIALENPREGEWEPDRTDAIELTPDILRANNFEHGPNNRLFVTWVKEWRIEYIFPEHKLSIEHREGKQKINLENIRFVHQLQQKIRDTGEVDYANNFVA